MYRIKDNIYVETEFLGCNPSFVVTNEGIVMIDTPQKPTDAFLWSKEIQKFGKIRYIINTDHHYDHAIGNFYFEGDNIVHEGTMQELYSQGREDLCKKWILKIDSQFEPVVKNYCVKPPQITFSERMSLFVGEDQFDLIHVVSHTADETLVYMPNKGVLFSGDTVCTNQFPTLRESYPISWLKALNLIESLHFDTLVPGHGEIGDKESFRKFSKEFSELINHALEKINQGYSRERLIQEMKYEDTVHSKYPPAFEEHFADIMKKSIGRLYDELKRGTSQYEKHSL